MDQTFTPLIERVAEIRERLNTSPLSDEQRTLLVDELSTLVALIQAHAGHEQGRAADQARQLAKIQEKAADALVNAARAQDEASAVQKEATTQQRRTARFTLWLAVATGLMALFAVCAVFVQLDANRREELRLIREARPWFTFVPSLEAAVPESTLLSFSIEALNTGPGIASYFCARSAYKQNKDSIGDLALDSTSVRQGTIGSNVSVMLQKIREDYSDPASKADSVVYLHLCCQFGAAGSGRKYYQEQVIYFRPIEFASADSAQRRKSAGILCGSKVMYWGEIVESGSGQQIRWSK
jgi:hypothetical protein